MIIGVTGGVGTGKSTILQFLKEEYQAAVIFADDVARELMEPGEASYEAVVAYFGNEILNSDEIRSINRSALAAIVFQDAEKLQVLNELTHPLVKEEILTRISSYRRQQVPLIVIEAALFIEAGYQDLVEELWVIHTDVEHRIRRLQASRGYTPQKTRDVMNNQLSSEEMEKAADFIINNNDDFEATKQQIRIHLNHA